MPKIYCFLLSTRNNYAKIYKHGRLLALLKIEKFEKLEMFRRLRYIKKRKKLEKLETKTLAIKCGQFAVVQCYQIGKI